jgi:hypothetical protein
VAVAVWALREPSGKGDRSSSEGDFDLLPGRRGGAIGSDLLDGALALPLAITSALCGTAQVFVLPGLCVLALLEGSTNNCITCVMLTAIGFVAIGGGLGLLSLVALLGMLG